MVASTVTLPRFVAGAACLDFVNTVDPRHREDRDDCMGSYRELVVWSHKAGLVTAAQARELTRRERADAAGADAVHRRALDLREAIYTLFGSRPAKSSEIASATLNDEVHRAQARADLTEHHGRWVWQWRSDTDLDRMLWPIARSAAELLVSEHLDRVRECEADNGCGWLFLDVSKNGRRRWCEMSVCGNRAKARRRRQQARPRRT